MTFAIWLTMGGAMLLFMAVCGSMLARLPISTAMVYLLAGLAVGPLGLALAAPKLADHGVLVEHVSEVIVLLSLFTAGMKMSLGPSDQRWSPPLGAAVLLGGILAPPTRCWRPRCSSTMPPTAIEFASHSPAKADSTTARPFRS